MGKHHQPLVRILYDKMLIGDDCWEWIAGCDGRGYPTLRYRGVMRSMHRVIYEWLAGPIPKGHDLDHECHNIAAQAGLCDGGKCIHRRCVNPAHLVPRSRRANLFASVLWRKSVGVKDV